MPYAEPQGARLHYEETGSGTPILFIHEYGGDHRRWEDQVVKTGSPYRDLGPRHFEPAKRSALARNLLERLEGLGFTVHTKEVAAAQPG